jgi:hypothetical protein
MSLLAASVWLHESRVGEPVLRRELAVPDAYLAPLRRHWAAVPVLAPPAAQIA